MGEEFKDLKTKFDTLVEKNDTLVDVIVKKSDNLVVKYYMLIGKHEALENRFDECNKCDKGLKQEVIYRIII